MSKDNQDLFSIFPVIAVNPSMRSTTNLLINNLAIADILFVFFCVPFTAADYLLPTWPFGNFWCKIVSLSPPILVTWCDGSLGESFAQHCYRFQVQYMIVVTCHASVYTLVLMSLDRFLAVVHPITSMSIRTERNAFM